MFWSHYSDKENTPVYPFGHGLSYTSFKYSNLSITKSKSSNISVKVSVDVSNVGGYDGKEVVQLYIRDLVGSITRPVKELKGFELIALQKGETKTIVFELTKKELGFFINNGDFIVEPGDFEIYVGGSSKISLKDKFTL